MGGTFALSLISLTSMGTPGRTQNASVELGLSPATNDSLTRGAGRTAGVATRLKSALEVPEPSSMSSRPARPQLVRPDWLRGTARGQRAF